MKKYIILILIMLFFGLAANVSAYSVQKQGDVNINAEVPAIEPLISNVQIESVGSTTAVISFDTNVQTIARIYYGSTTSYGFMQVDDNYTTHHVFYLSGLIPDSLYHFKIIAEDSGARQVETADDTFHTLPLAPATFTPEVYNITQDSAGIKWTTPRAMKCTIYYGKSIDYGFIFAENLFAVFHDVTIEDLTPDTLYHYKINCVDEYNAAIETPDYNFTTLAPVLPISIIEEPAETILEEAAGSPLYQISLLILTILAVLLVLAGMYLSAIPGFPLLSFLDQIIGFFIYLDKCKWGIVYDSKTKKPVPNVKVLLYEYNHKKLLATCITNNLGQYGFDLKKGKYYLVVEKTDYAYTSKIIKKDYHKELIDINSEKTPNIDIPVDADAKVVEYRLSLVAKTSKFLDAIRLPVLVFGSILSIIFYLAYPVEINVLILGLYGVMWVWEITRFSKVNKA